MQSVEIISARWENFGGGPFPQENPDQFSKLLRRQSRLLSKISERKRNRWNRCDVDNSWDFYMRASFTRILCTFHMPSPRRRKNSQQEYCTAGTDLINLLSSLLALGILINVTNELEILDAPERVIQSAKSSFLRSAWQWKVQQAILARDSQLGKPQTSILDLTPPPDQWVGESHPPWLITCFLGLQGLGGRKVASWFCWSSCETGPAAAAWIPWDSAVPLVVVRIHLESITCRETNFHWKVTALTTKNMSLLHYCSEWCDSKS